MCEKMSGNVNRIRVFVKLGLLAFTIMMLFILSAKPALSKDKQRIKTSCREICNNLYQINFSTVHTTNLPLYTNVTWTVSDTRVADIVYVDTLTKENRYAKSVTMQASGECFINAKFPGTTWLTVSANGYKKKKIKINIFEFGDAIGYYAKTGKNRYGITDDEKKAADVLKSVVENIVTDDMSRVEKIRVVNDYISKTTTYDMDRFKSRQLEFYDGSAAGPLLYHTAVCAGYSVTFDAFMYYLGIPCRYIYGESKGRITEDGTIDGGGSHAWNLVMMDDGQWYHIDVTWNDDDSDFYDNEGVCYKYFLLRDDAIVSTRTWDISLFPACTGTMFADYRDVLNREVVQRKLPGYTVLGSKQELIEYLIQAGRDRQINIPVAYRGDSWLSELERDQIQNEVGTHMYFWWGKSGSYMGEYRWYDFRITY